MAIPAELGPLPDAAAGVVRAVESISAVDAAAGALESACDVAGANAKRPGRSHSAAAAAHARQTLMVIADFRLNTQALDQRLIEGLFV
jgi:hypothetical protein